MKEKQKHDATPLAVAMVLAQADVPVLLTGEPGVAKSYLITSAARQLAAHYRAANPDMADVESAWNTAVFTTGAHQDPTELLGVPRAFSRSELIGDMAWLPPDFAGMTRNLFPAMFMPLLRASAHGHPSLLLLDDFTAGLGPKMEAALMSALMSATIADVPIKNMRRIAIANPADLVAGATTLSAATANRVAHLDWPSNHDLVLSFARYALSGGRYGPRATGEPFPIIDQSQIPAYYMRAFAMIGAAARALPTAVIAIPDDADLQSKAFPTFRTRELCAFALAGCELAGWPWESPAAMMAVTGLIGSGAAIELLRFMRAGAVDPEWALANPGEVNVSMPSSEALALLTAVATFVIGEGVPEHDFYAAFELLKRFERSLDVATVAASMLIRANGELAAPHEVPDLTWLRELYGAYAEAR